MHVFSRGRGSEPRASHNTRPWKMIRVTGESRRGSDASMTVHRVFRFYINPC